MAQCLSSVVLLWISLGTVLGAGFLGVRPQSNGDCRYDDINKAHFSYDQNHCEGPMKWCNVHQCWSTCGSDIRQSPINIQTAETIREGFGDLQFRNLHLRVPANISNNGHSPDFDCKVETDEALRLKKNIILTNVPMRGDKQYIFAQLHIHIGNETNGTSDSNINDDEGSEHSIDGQFYPMEAHLVFYDSSFDNIGVAKPVNDSLVVLGVMIKVRDDDSEEENEEEEDKRENEEEEEDQEEPEQDDKDLCSLEEGKMNEKFYRKHCYRKRTKCKGRFAKRLSDNMEHYFEEIRNHDPVKPDLEKSSDDDIREYQCGDHPDLDFIYNNCMKRSTYESRNYREVESGISPLDVLPCDQSFYTYAGSLTTPPCYETVQWIVFKCPITVSKKAYRNLQLVQDSNEDELKLLGVKRHIMTNNTGIQVYRNHEN